RSNPRSLAIRLAIGEAFTRPSAPPPAGEAVAGASATGGGARGAAPGGSRGGPPSSAPALRGGSSPAPPPRGAAPAAPPPRPGPPRPVTSDLRGLPNPRDGIADRQGVALLRQHFDEGPGEIRLVDHVGLIGLDLDQLLADGHVVADGLEPLENRSLLHRVREPGHDDLVRHQRLPSSVWSAALTTLSACGIAACSIRFEYGMWTSAPVTRSTGASRWSNACPWMRAARLAPTPPWGHPSSTITARFVFCTDRRIVSRS